MKKVYNSDAINKFRKFKNTFASNKNVADCKISNSLRLIDNNSENLIKINNNRENKIKENEK